MEEGCSKRRYPHFATIIERIKNNFKAVFYKKNVMYLLDLYLKNIGPFRECHLSLSQDRERDGMDAYLNSVKHLIITGQNGTGKSIILDAIRAILYGIWSNQLERDIIPNKADFAMSADFNVDGSLLPIRAAEFISGDQMSTNQHEFNVNIFAQLLPKYSNNWILDFWTSKLSSDSYKIDSLQNIDPTQILIAPLSGIHRNVDVVKTLAFLDYLRGSHDIGEKELGEKLYNTAVDILNSTINDGEFLNISRKDLTPLFKQHGHIIDISKLSSGSIYILQRMLSLLTKVYAAHIINKTEVESMFDIPGLLLIDEAENHLHPKWQKTFFSSILKIFPNIQIVASTHSPFIVSSIENAAVYVCKAGTDGCYVKDETEIYSNKAIEEILRTPLFGTDSFNQTISDLLQARKNAIKENDNGAQIKIEEQLIALNPEYFKYLNIDKLS